MPSALPHSFFTEFLNVYDGQPDWTPLNVRNPLLVTGTANNDDIAFNPVALSVVNAGAGNDRIQITGNLGLATTLNGGDGSDQIFGGNGVDLINGGADNDYIVGGAGIDTLNGGDMNGPGIDTVSYENATATAANGITLTLNANGGASFNAGSTNAGLDLITGGFENVVGSNFKDTITGNAGNNVLIGLGGDDTLNGGDGSDTFIGGPGRDTMSGGFGADTFLFLSVSDSTPTAPDRIDPRSDSGLLQYDTVDLTRIDADLDTPGDQPFELVSGNAQPGQVMVLNAGAGGEVVYSLIHAVQKGVGGGVLDIEMSSGSNPYIFLL